MRSTIFSPFWRGIAGDAEIEFLAADEQRDAAVLRHPLLGYVKVGKNLTRESSAGCMFFGTFLIS